MKSIFSILFFLICTSASAQFVAKMEVKEPIVGICNDKEVYVLFPSFKAQKRAVCPVSDEEILKRLNAIKFLKENAGYEDKGIIGLVINCKGDLVKCKIDNKTKSPELDKQIEEVFNFLGAWKAGKLNGNDVDSSRLFGFKITNGVFTF